MRVLVLAALILFSSAALAETNLIMPEQSDQLLMFACQTSHFNELGKDTFMILQKTPNADRLKAIGQGEFVGESTVSDFVIMKFPNLTLSSEFNGESMMFVNSKLGQSPSDQAKKILRENYPLEVVEGRSRSNVVLFKINSVGENSVFHEVSYPLLVSEFDNRISLEISNASEEVGLCDIQYVSVKEAQEFLVHKQGGVTLGDEVVAKLPAATN